MTLTRHSKGTHLLTTGFFLVALLLAAIEDWYTRVDFTTDGISYLNVLNGLRLHDWKVAFNPQWSIGYPFLIFWTERLFAPSPAGEWLAIHALNLVVFAASFWAFLFLLRSVDAEGEGFSSGDPAVRTFLFVCAICIFLCTELCVDAASRVGPDSLISALFLLALALTIRLSRSMKIGSALLLGLVLGAGYLVKAIFLPLAAILLLVLVCASWRKKKLIPVVSAAVLAMAVVAVPYIRALSWSYGSFTWGESGALNYAFHVNAMPHWTNWQGGPPRFGAPIHPTHELMDRPLVFEFSEPFHTTYPPFNNLAYWYKGYKHFFSLKNQTIAIARNLYYLAKLLIALPVAYGFLACIILLFRFVRDKSSWRRSLLRMWTFFVPPALGILLYLLVHLEGRYVASFLLVLGVLPFVALERLELELSRKQRSALLAILLVTTAATMGVVNHTAFAGALHRRSYAGTEQWRLAAYLKQIGLKAGDKVAAISWWWPPTASCTWAYEDRLRIVAEIGSNAVAQNHEELNAQAYWQGTPEVRQKVMDLFRQAGALAVIATDKPKEANDPGWVHLAGTQYWIYRLQPFSL